MNSQEIVMVTIYAVVAIVGLMLAFAWIVFPFMVKSRLDKVVTATERSREHLSEIELTLAYLKKRMEPVKPAMPKTSGRPAKMVMCACRNCSKPLQFDANNFDPNNPPMISCPHCGAETVLYLPATPTGI